MLFNSLTYLVFFAAVFAVYWAMPWHRGRLALLLVASWLFYAAWYPVYLLLMIGATFLNYAAGLAVGSTRAARPVLSRRIVAATVTVNLAGLAFFKYLDFGLSSAGGLVTWLTGTTWSPPAVEIFLPLGISFYTFQMIAYVVDVSRGECETIRSPWKMSLFIAFFPQLIAGPIVRTREFLPQLESKRTFSAAMLLHGFDLIAIGLVKKVLIADQLAPFVERGFAAPEGLGAVPMLLAVYAYAIQIYCDFSGYTDIGRGCASCLGYTLPVNFSYPYFAVNLSDFWRRWHITLSTWLRDYLYIPLGGNRGGSWLTYRNLLLTMVLGGLWHGASWCFVAWGLLHGVGLVMNRMIHERCGVPVNEPLLGGRAYRWLAMGATFHFVCLGWVFFRAPDFATAFAVLAEIGSAPLAGLASPGSAELFRVLMMAIVLAGLWGAHVRTRQALFARWQESTAWHVVRPAVYFGVTALVTLCTTQHGAQFIYFQF